MENPDCLLIETWCWLVISCNHKRCVNTMPIVLIAIRIKVLLIQLFDQMFRHETKANVPPKTIKSIVYVYVPAFLYVYQVSAVLLESRRRHWIPWS